MTKTVLILGPTGRVGRHTATAFEMAGWTVRMFDRKTDDLRDAATGADVIVNGWNPTYDQWAADVPKLTSRVITAAKAVGATVILPGNVYNFGPDAPDRFAEDTPHGATNPLGQIRIDLEAAYRASGVQTIVLRAGDFIDTEASGNWFDMVMVKTLAKDRLTYPGALDRSHAWAYLPDLARAAVALANRRTDLAQFEDVPFPGYTMSGADLAETIGNVVGCKITAKRMNWLPIQIARPFWPLAKGILEMKYIWSKPHFLDGAKFDLLVPDFQHTDPAQALAAALRAVDVHPNETVTRRTLAAQ